MVTSDLVGWLVADVGKGGGDEMSGQLVELGEIVRRIRHPVRSVTYMKNHVHHTS